MTLSTSSISYGRSRIKKIKNEANEIKELVNQLISELLNEENFNKFCNETTIGNKILLELNELKEMISDKMISRIKSLSNETNSFLERQEYLNEKKALELQKEKEKED